MSKSPKCQCCKQEYAVDAWQPFGPSETVDCFTGIGSHYRGFPVIKVCDACHTKISQAVHESDKYGGFHFTYSDIPFVVVKNEVTKSPF